MEVILPENVDKRGSYSPASYYLTIIIVLKFIRRFGEKEGSMSGKGDGNEAEAILIKNSFCGQRINVRSQSILGGIEKGG